MRKDAHKIYDRPIDGSSSKLGNQEEYVGKGRGTGRLKQNRISSGLPNLLHLYITLIAVAGTGLLAYLAARTEWGPSTLGETSFFILLIVVAGSFPLRVAPKVLADV